MLVDNFVKRKKKILKQKERGNSRKKLDIACFQHDMAHGDFKYLLRRTTSNKVLWDKTFDTTKNPKHYE